MRDNAGIPRWVLVMGGLVTALVVYLVGIREDDRRDDCRALLDTLGPKLAEIQRLEQDPGYAAAAPETMKAMAVAYTDLAQSVAKIPLSEQSKQTGDLYGRALRDLVRGYEELADALPAKEETRIKSATRTLTMVAGDERQAITSMQGVCRKR